MVQKVRVLNLANKRLPCNDYRIKYANYGRMAKMSYGLPGKPECVEDEDYFELGFREGLGIGDLVHFARLMKHLVEHCESYDLLHCFSTKLQLLGPIVAKLTGSRAVSTITGFGRTFNRDELRFRVLRPLYLAVLRRSVSAAEAVFFQNHGDMEWLKTRFPELADKMHWIGSGVEAEVLGQKDFQSPKLRVLMVARIMNDKGIQEYLRVARQLSRGPFHFFLAGPPSVGQESLYQEVQVAHQEGVLEYLGELDRERLAEQYQSSHVFAFPSHGEGMPRVMLEAGHALLCPLASDIPAHRDLVKPGGGLLIDRLRTVESMVSHLRVLEGDRALVARNASAYQKYVTENFSVQSYAARVDVHLRRLFPGHGEEHALPALISRAAA